ncbi:MAG: PleD family two-component system response regulator [Alphaproteobacteria bacterium]|jgi:two-component system cell cycle response regulator|nr:PleD family two-component system response regulator [Candidatus Jidaibacter sp.]
MTARVLVVDDVEFNVKLLDAKLRQDYYQVYTAVNGVKAVEMAKQIKPDIILMDVMMPEMNGLDATKILKSDPEVSYIPIIMVTALNAQEDKVRGLEAGADDFLTKPINDQQLMTRLKSLVRLKFMNDELRLRNQTGLEFGFGGIDMHRCNKISGAKVAVIDDEDIQFKKIQDKLANSGIETSMYRGIEGVINGEVEYSLIIISTTMLEHDGLMLCSLLRSIEKFRHTPILIVVDESDDISLAKGLEIGVNDYLLSPIDTNELMARVATQIKRKNYHEELKQNYLESLQSSVTDSMTGLFNRRYFETHIRNMIEGSNFGHDNLALIMIDIDYFKKVNDTYGHQSGDAVLVQCAQILRNNLRLTDMSARYGGEEFIIVLPATCLEVGMNVAERIRQSVTESKFAIPVEPNAIDVTISAGVSSIKQGDNLESLVARADKNLYQAKEAGRNQVVADLR